MTTPAESGSALSERSSGQATSLLWVLAVLAAVAALGARAFAPALPGVWVGVDHIITAVKLATAFCSQLFAVLSAALMVSLVVALVRSEQPAHLRAYAVGSGLLVSLAVMISSAATLPHLSRLVVAVSAAVLAVLVGRLTLSHHTHRAAALLLMVTAAAGLVRVLAIVTSGLYLSQAVDALRVVARVLATVSNALEATAILVGLAAVVFRFDAVGSARWRPRWAPLVVLMALVVATLWVAQRGGQPESAGFSLLVARALHTLLDGPPPYAPELVRGAWQVIGWVVVWLALVVALRGRLMGAVLALALVARSSLEVPLCAMALAIAALALTLQPSPDLQREMAEIEALERRRVAARAAPAGEPCTERDIET